MNEADFPRIRDVIDVDAIPIEEEGGAWLRPTGRQNRRRNQPTQRKPKTVSFAAAASAATTLPQPMAATPASTAQTIQECNRGILYCQDQRSDNPSQAKCTYHTDKQCPDDKAVHYCPQPHYSRSCKVTSKTHDASVVVDHLL
jgi:hypothetical protein